MKLSVPNILLFIVYLFILYFIYTKYSEYIYLPSFYKKTLIIFFILITYFIFGIIPCIIISIVFIMITHLQYESFIEGNSDTVDTTDINNILKQQFPKMIDSMKVDDISSNLKKKSDSESINKDFSSYLDMNTLKDNENVNKMKDKLKNNENINKMKNKMKR